MKETNEYPNRIKIPGTSWYKNKPGKPEDWGPSLTSQEFKDECDTQKILERYSDLNLPLPSAAVEAVYGDFTDLRNLQEHLNHAKELVRQTQEGFMQLDARTRKKFDNDVGKMAQWLADPDNKEEAIKLGLMRPNKEEQTPQKVSVSTITSSDKVPAKETPPKG